MWIAKEIVRIMHSTRYPNYKYTNAGAMEVASLLG